MFAAQRFTRGRPCKFESSFVSYSSPCVVAVLYGQRQLAESVDLATFLATWGAAVLVEIGMAFTRRARTVFCEGEASGVLRPARRLALAHIRLFTGIAFARHPGAAHAAEFFVPRLVG